MELKAWGADLMVLVNGCDRFYYCYILKLKLSSKWMDSNI